MPLVRITLRKDLLPETKKAISDAIHKGVMEVFNVTQPDFWHIFNEVEPNNIITSKSYMGVEHGDKAVLITILVGEGRDADKKKTLFASIVKHASELQKEVPPNDIIIIMQENDAFANWSFGNGLFIFPDHMKDIYEKKQEK